MAWIQASFKTNLLPADFPLVLPKTIILTNTSHGPYTRFRWKLTPNGGVPWFNDWMQEVTYTASLASQLPLEIELMVWIPDGENAAFPVRLANHHKKVFGSGDPVADYITWSAVAWDDEVGDPSPPDNAFANEDRWKTNFGGGNKGYWATSRTFTYDFAAVESMQTAPFIDLKVLFKNVAGSGPSGTQQSGPDLTGAITASLSTVGLTCDEATKYIIADVTGLANTTGEQWTCGDIEGFNQLGTYPSGWQISVWRIEWPVAGDHSVITGTVGPDSQYTSNLLGIDFVGVPREGWSPLGVTFTDISLTQFVEWTWTFGDGSGSVQQHPWNEYEITEPD